MKVPTTERLANALHEAGAPAYICNRARLGDYDDFKSLLTFPKVALIDDLRANELHEFARRVMSGEFDATREEADAWYRARTNVQGHWRGVKTDRSKKPNV